MFFFRTSQTAPHRTGPRNEHRANQYSALFAWSQVHLGRQPLYGALLARLRERGLHVVIGGIALPNDASAGLHEALGFRKVAHFSEVGKKFGRWLDVGYWELKLGAH
ncbi:GNAT family N-acetyltransferase [Massilia sp. TW-1]|uniref:GNAT family N-acetyltransferase n=1 Tax=Telluria antibiotica TaxID=2717319 RepID=A0ABX0PN67_9BURK|nr:GNAT family N-acetyltransferase [Telluria antibiotica]